MPIWFGNYILFGKMSLKPFRSLLIIIIVTIVIIIVIIIIIIIVIIIIIIIVIIIIIIVFIRECRSESCKTSAHGTCSFSDIFLEPYYSHVEAISFAEIDKRFG